MPLSCGNISNTGIYCNISTSICSILQPCQNNGTCIDTNVSGYMSLCRNDFIGRQCEINICPCQSNTCRNGGIDSRRIASGKEALLHFVRLCNETSSTTFICTYLSGWTADRCEKLANYCENITCYNDGVCRSLTNNYRCECLGNSYSDRHCEITSSQITLYKIASRSFAFASNCHHN